MSGSGIHTFTVAVSDEAHPRQSEGGLLEREDGSLVLVWEEYVASEQGSGDDAPNRLATMTSTDGGFTRTDRRTLLYPSTDSVSVYSPNLLRLPSGEVLPTYYENQLHPRRP